MVADTGYDADGNGLYEHLRVLVWVDVRVAGDYGLVALLADDLGRTVTLGSLTPHLRRAAPLTGVALREATQALPIYFNGYDIRMSAVDGPYALELALHDRSGRYCDSLRGTTHAYTARAFQGFLFELVGIVDEAIDLDAHPGFEALRVRMTLRALADGEVMVQGQLFAGETYLADALQSTRLSRGIHVVTVEFPGASIAAAGVSGAYTVYLTLSDSNYTEDATHVTGSYRVTDFSSASVPSLLHLDRPARHGLLAPSVPGL